MCNSLCRKVYNVAGTHYPGFIGAMGNVPPRGAKLVRSSWQNKRTLTTFSGFGVVVFSLFFYCSYDSVALSRRLFTLLR